MSKQFKTRASGGTTWFVERNTGETEISDVGIWSDKVVLVWEKVGVVNYPGDGMPQTPFHAVTLVPGLTGYFPTLADAVAFIENHS